MLKSYGCWDRVPESVRAYLTRADPAYGHLRPEELAGKRQVYFRTMGPEVMLAAAQRRAEALGLRAVMLAASLNDVEARPVGEVFGHMANEIEHLGQLAQPPCMLICGGELVVKVGDATGLGGRNQEVVLAAATRIAGSRTIVMASVDSEGGDGPTDAAGGIVDGCTLERAESEGLDIAAELGEPQFLRRAAGARGSVAHRRARHERARPAADLHRRAGRPHLDGARALSDRRSRLAQVRGTAQVTGAAR